jgi:uncharacterized RDD family membrane protein YckC
MTSDLPPPGILRRFGAMLYDSLLLLALLMMLSYPYVWLTGGDKPGLVMKTAYQFYLLAICFFFYAGFWVRGGQTLGLRTWRLKLVNNNGGPITWSLALKRFAFAWVSLLCFGLGFFWIMFDRDRLAWHDRWSGTRLVILRNKGVSTLK